MAETYLVAFSFSGKERELVQAIAVAVRNILGDGTVFFDDWFLPRLAMQDANVFLDDVYRRKSVLVVPCISESWGEKPWTKGEYRAIKTQEILAPEETPAGAFHKVMPLRVGDGNIPEYPEMSAIAPDVRNKTIGQVARLIVERLRMKVPNAGRCVYLAKPVEALQKQHEQIKSFLLRQGWTLLPRDEASAENREAAIRDIKQCRAFIDLLEPGATLLQRPLIQVAIEHTKKTFCYQQRPNAGDDQATGASSPPAKIIHNSFDDFLNHLAGKLRSLWVDPMPIGEWPRVQLALRCKKQDALLDQVQAWCQEHRIELDELEGTDTVLTKYERTKCHGFLIICDEQTISGDVSSTQKDMSDCRQIVIAEQKRGAPPPVGLLYRHPPDPVWGKLRRGGPPMVHQILWSDPKPEELDSFFAEVRNVPA